jgi:hypothetical protein
MNFEEMSLTEIVLWGLAILFGMWLFTGGPERIENKNNPFIEPLVEPLGDGSVYGAGGTVQTGVENIIQEGIYAGWTLNNRTDFSFLTPPLWTSVVKGNFGETEYGEMGNGTITLDYQYGKKVNQLEFENNPNYRVEYGTVNGEWTRFVKPKNNSGDITGAYIKKNRWRGMTIYTDQKLTPEEERQVFEIINTVKI